MRPLVALLLLTVTAAPAAARTLELGCFDMTGFAVISPEAPLQGWVGMGAALRTSSYGYFSSTAFDVHPPRSLLVKFDLSQIPKDMRITSAELVLPVSYQPTLEVRFYVYRIAAAWGPGVCELFRMRRPQELPWSEPGARGPGTDHALNPSAKIELTRFETDIRVNVTADVELWHSGAVANEGWVIRAEEQGQWIRFASPIYIERDRWKLRVTYEPKP